MPTIGVRSIHDGFWKWCHICTNVSFWGNARCCGGWGCNYFRENGRYFGLFAGVRWQFGAGTGDGLECGKTHGKGQGTVNQESRWERDEYWKDASERTWQQKSRMSRMALKPF